MQTIQKHTANLTVMRCASKRIPPLERLSAVFAETLRLAA
jgi:hypothetical protein